MLYSNHDLRKLIIPLIIEQALAILVGMVDTIMVSAAGEAAVSGVSLVDAINVLMINVLSALSTGGAVVAGHALGRKENDEANRTAWQISQFATLFALAVCAVFLVFRTQLLSLMFGRIEPDVMRASNIYLSITALSFPALALYNSCAALFRTMNLTSYTMRISLLMNGINVAGNAICIFGLGMGVEGVAIPTTISRCIAAAIIFAMIRDPKRQINLSGRLTPGFDSALIKKILYIAVPNGMESGMFQLGKLLVMSAVSTLGTSAIAANAVANSMANWNILPALATNMAVTAVISVCVGAGEYDQARYYTKKLCVAAAACVSALTVILLFTTPFFVSLYNLGPEASDLASLIIRYHGIMAAFMWIPAFTLPNTLRASGDVMFPMVVAIASMWIFRVGVAYVFTYVFHLGLLGIWIAMTCDWICRILFYVARYKSGAWTKMKKL